jgi:hypothetical protein
LRAPAIAQRFREEQYDRSQKEQVQSTTERISGDDAGNPSNQQNYEECPKQRVPSGYY